MLKAIHETLEYMFFPDEHWRHIKTNNPLERVVREIHRRTRVVGSFPDGNAALMLVAARLRHIAGIRATVPSTVPPAIRRSFPTYVPAPPRAPCGRRPGTHGRPHPVSLPQHAGYRLSVQLRPLYRRQPVWAH
jgi:hypothetical protein